MNYNPIIVVAGEPHSVFLEIFFKTIKKKKFIRPIILIASKKLLIEQMKKLGFYFKVNIINENNLIVKKLDNKNINLIDVNFNFKNSFDKISDKSNPYISECFDIALKLMKNISHIFLNLLVT